MNPPSLLAVDPGNERTGYALFGSYSLMVHGDVPNDEFLSFYCDTLKGCGQVACEFPFPRGETASWQLFNTAKFAGRLEQLALQHDVPFYLANRKDVKLHLTKSTTTNDAAVKAALIARYGGKEKAIGGGKCAACRGRGHFGSKKDPTPTCHRCAATGVLPIGPLHGVAGDAWAAVAVGLTFLDGACQSTESREQQRKDKRVEVTARMAAHRALKDRIVGFLSALPIGELQALTFPNGDTDHKALAFRLGLKPALVKKAVIALEKKPEFLTLVKT